MQARCDTPCCVPAVLRTCARLIDVDLDDAAPVLRAPRHAQMAELHAEAATARAKAEADAKAQMEATEARMRHQAELQAERNRGLDAQLAAAQSMLRAALSAGKKKRRRRFLGIF